MKRRWWRSGAALAALVAMAACRSPVNTLERENPRAVTDDVAAQKVIYGMRLEDTLAVESVIQGQREGLLMVQATVRNVTTKDFAFQYKYEWFDGTGFQVSGPSSTWVPRRVQGGEQFELLGVAPTPAVVDFRLKLQEADH